MPRFGSTSVNLVSWHRTQQGVIEMVRYFMGRKVVRHYGRASIWYTIEGLNRRFEAAAEAIDWIRSEAGTVHVQAA